MFTYHFIRLFGQAAASATHLASASSTGSGVRRTNPRCSRMRAIK